MGARRRRRRAELAPCRLGGPCRRDCAECCIRGHARTGRAQRASEACHRKPFGCCRQRLGSGEGAGPAARAAHSRSAGFQVRCPARRALPVAIPDAESLPTRFWECLQRPTPPGMPGPGHCRCWQVMAGRLQVVAAAVSDRGCLDSATPCRVSSERFRTKSSESEMGHWSRDGPNGTQVTHAIEREKRRRKS